MSASSSTISGLLPPSSSTTRFSVRPAVSPTTRPVFVDPVNEIIRTFGSSTSACPTSGPPQSTCRTPDGSPASSKMRAITTPPVTGVFRSLLSTTAFPSTSAGPSDRIASTIGKFQGVITPTTPIGTRRAVEVRPGIGDGSSCSS